MAANVDAVTGPAHVTHSLCNRFQPKRKMKYRRRDITVSHIFSDYNSAAVG